MPTAMVLAIRPCATSLAFCPPVMSVAMPKNSGGARSRNGHGLNARRV